MQTYINTQTLQYPITEQDIRLEYINTSFGNVFKAPDKFKVVFDSPLPNYNPVIETVREIKPTLTLKGNWEKCYEVVPLFSEQDQQQALADDLSKKKSQKWEAIKTKRNTLTQTGGYKALGNWFHSDTFSRSQQLGLARRADRVEYSNGNMDAQFSGDEPNSLLFWKTMDGSFVPVTPRLAQSISDAAERSDISIFKYAEQLNQQVQASTNPDSVDIEQGWPETYQEV